MAQSSLIRDVSWRMVLVTAGAILAVSPAAAQPTAEFQFSAITGSNSVINVSRVPVTNSAGAVGYYDITTTFNVSALGVPTIAGTTIKLSQALTVASFKAGKYVASTVPTYSIVLTGPGIAAGGTTTWTTTSTTTQCGFPSSAQWWTGPIASNPLAARITAAKITSTDFSYGIVGAGANCSPFGLGHLIGVSQVGNTLTFADFTNGPDYSIPKAQVVFTLSP